MKKYLSFASLLIALILLGVSCKKFDFDYNSTGESIGTFRLLSPGDNQVIMLNSAAPATPVVFSWSTAAQGDSSPVKYTVKVSLRNSNNTAPIWQGLSMNNGAATQVTVTHADLDAALASAGIGANAEAELSWTVTASNSTGTEVTATPFNVKITRFGIGISAFTIFSPVSSTDVFNMAPISSSNFLHFKWQKATATPASNAVTYKVVFAKKQYDANGNAITPNFSTPLFSFDANTNGTDTLADISYQDMSDALNANGFSDVGQVAELQWTVIAMASTFKAQAMYYNELHIIREVSMYMVGAFQGWDPSNGVKMIPDKRSGLLNNMYYIYLQLPAGEFKFLQGTAWGQPDYGDGGGGNLAPGGANINIASAGIYRVSMNRSTLKFDVKEGRMGFVGGATHADWNPPAVFPNNKMGFTSTNLFCGVQDFMTGGWKLIDNNEWNNGSNTPSETRSYGTSQPSGSPLQINGDNFSDIATAGARRVIWDGTNYATGPTYQIMNATEMRIVGNGMQGVNEWDPGNSPQMTYLGNGKWSLTLALIGGKEIKFLAGNQWGDFDYEDNSGQSTATGTPRPIQFNGGNNFKTPVTSGTYTVLLDENNQTVTITP